MFLLEISTIYQSTNTVHKLDEYIVLPFTTPRIAELYSSVWPFVVPYKLSTPSIYYVGDN
jgi:hypothetical protein